MRKTKKYEIKKATDLYIKLDDYRRNGAQRGYDVGFETFREKYTWGNGTCTDWTGHPTSGKSQLLLEFALNVSIKHGVKHLLYMPDVGNDTELFADLIHKFTHKSMDKRYRNYINEKEMQKAINFLDEYFFIYNPKNILEKTTPLDVWNAGIELRESTGVSSVLIDSWKDLYHDIREYGREDMYLANILMIRNKLAENYDMHFHTIIHPTKPRTDASGNPLPPNAYDLKGGSEWFNNGKTIISVNRPDKDNNIAEIDIRKVKPRSLGKPGKYFLNFDIAKFRYYEEVNGKKCFAYEFKTQEKKHNNNELPDDLLDDIISSGVLPF